MKKKYRDPHKGSIWEHPRILAYSILILSEQYWLTNKENKNTKANIRHLGCSHRIIGDYTFKETIDWNKFQQQKEWV